jgi:hypothetical protein
MFAVVLDVCVSLYVAVAVVVIVCSIGVTVTQHRCVSVYTCMCCYLMLFYVIITEYYSIFDMENKRMGFAKST